MIDRIIKNNGHRWTNEEIKGLMKMWAADMPVQEIATLLKSTKFAIQKMVTRLRQEGVPLKRRTRGRIAGRKGNPWSQSQIEYLLKRREQRATAEEIADDLGRTVISINAMLQTLRKEGINVPVFGSGCRRKWNPVIAMASMADFE